MDRQQQIIEKFIRGEMSTKEALEFENELSINAELTKAYEEELLVHSFTKEAGRIELLKTLDDFDAEMKASVSEEKTRSLWIKRVLPIAASLIVFIGVYQFLKPEGMNSNEVFTTYFETYESPSNIRDVDGSEAPSSWEKASASYRQKDYQAALSNFNLSKDIAPAYLVAYYKGMCQLNLDPPKFQQALNSFDEVLLSDNDYRQQAQWYKALTLLKLGETEMSLNLLSSIVEKKSYNYQKAEQILDLRIND